MSDTSAATRPSNAPWLARLFVWGVWAAMVFAALMFVAKYGANIPILDEWEIIVPALTGEQPITLEWLWRLHGEHRIVLLRLSLLGLAELTGSDFRAALVFNVLALAGIALALMLAARQVRGRTSFADAFFPLALLHFGHFENFLSGIQIAYILVAIFTAAFLLVIVLRGASLTLGAVVLAGICLVLLPLCGAHGLAYVPALGLWLGYAALRQWFCQEPHAKRNGLVTLLFVAGSVILLCLYFVGYQKYETVPDADLMTALSTSMEVLVMSVDVSHGGFLARSVSLFLGLSLVLITVGILVYRVWRGSASDRSRALGLLAFMAASICLALALGWGRAGIGTGPRYAVLTVFALCCSYFVWGIYLPFAGRFLQWLLFILMCVQFWPQMQFGRAMARENYRRHSQDFERNLLAGVPASVLGESCRGNVFHDDYNYCKQRVPVLARMLRKAGIGQFRYLKDPPVREVAYAAVPIELHDMTWNDGVVEGSGVDPYMIFALERPRYVYGIRVRYIYPQAPDMAYLQIFWRRSDREEWDTESRNTALVLLNPTQERTTTVVVNDVIDQFRIDPDFKPCVYRIVEITLLVPDWPESPTPR